MTRCERSPKRSDEYLLRDALDSWARAVAQEKHSRAAAERRANTSKVAFALTAGNAALPLRACFQARKDAGALAERERGALPAAVPAAPQQ